MSPPPEINPPEPRFVIPPARWTLARSSFTSFIAIRNYSTDVIIYFRKPSADIVGDVIRPLRGTRFIIHEGTRGNIHTRLTRVAVSTRNRILKTIVFLIPPLHKRLHKLGRGLLIIAVENAIELRDKIPTRRGGGRYEAEERENPIPDSDCGEPVCIFKGE